MSDVRTTEWRAESAVNFPTIIFGRYRSDTPKFQAKKLDGTVIEPNDPFWDTLNAVALAAKDDPAAWLAQRQTYGDLAPAAARPSRPWPGSTRPGSSRGTCASSGRETAATASTFS